MVTTEYEVTTQPLNHSTTYAILYICSSKLSHTLTHYIFRCFHGIQAAMDAGDLVYVIKAPAVLEYVSRVDVIQRLSRWQKRLSANPVSPRFNMHDPYHQRPNAYVVCLL